jgi:hypothetical protein
MASINPPPPVRRDALVLIALTAVLACVHVFLVTRNWHAGQLAGHEFRQTQTAISAYFIQRENNFAIAYPTPVLGKPWTIPMEFPLYQWLVVAVSNATHTPLTESGRVVTLLCFYLTLPALFLLLRQLGLALPQRLAGVCVALSCPLYIFYSRAFLIESMALMFSVWFLVGFVETMRTRRITWLLVASLCGAGAGLVKVTDLMAWIVPAAAYGLYCVRRDWPRGGQDARALRQTLIWGLGAALLPCATSIWWVQKANALKSVNPAGAFLTSESLHMFNFGSWALRTSKDTWSHFLNNWHSAIMPLGWMAVLAVAGLLLLRRNAWPAALAVVAFLAPQITFPILFTWHDYYYYAIGLFWVIAASLVIDAVSSRWRCVGLGVLLATLALNLADYGRHYATDQRRASDGGSHLVAVLRDMTPADSVLVIAGDDWSSVIPYYARRRALMLRHDHEQDWTMIDSSFRNLANEDVAALVLIGDQRSNQELVQRASSALGIDPALCFRHRDADVYVSSYHRSLVVQKLQPGHPYGEVSLAEQAPAPANDAMGPKAVPAGLRETIFKYVSPRPTQYDFAHGLELSTLDGMEVLGAHPDAALWVTPPAGATGIEWQFEIYGPAYQNKAACTDGVEFIVVEKTPDGATREIYRRLLDPASVEADRGLQTVQIAYTPSRAGAELVFMTRPNGHYAFDWAYWRKIEVR